MIKLQASSLQSGLRDCSIDGKFQILIFWVQESFCPKTRRPESKRPNSRHSCAQSPSECQSPRVCEKTSAFPVCQLRKFYIKSNISNIKLPLQIPQISFDTITKNTISRPLIKIHHVSFIFIQVNSGNTRFSLRLDNKSLELY